VKRCVKVWKEKECVEPSTHYHNVILYNLSQMFELLDKSTLKSTHFRQKSQSNESKNIYNNVLGGPNYDCFGVIYL
jgi:hypothetical protein